MNNKILIGSIIAVAILIGVSFTSVVGYNSIESDKKLSPLFNIRTSRAVDKDSKDLSCEYVGKGEEINILIPKIDNNKALIQEVIDRIRKMDDKTYDELIDLLIQHIQEKDDFQDYTKEEISLFINQLENRRPPTLYTCMLDPPLFCFSELIRYIIKLIILIPIFLVACIIVPTNPTFN